MSGCNAKNGPPSLALAIHSACSEQAVVGWFTADRREFRGHRSACALGHTKIKNVAIIFSLGLRLGGVATVPF
jgi:hypothetical protein